MKQYAILLLTIFLLHGCRKQPAPVYAAAAAEMRDFVAVAATSSASTLAALDWREVTSYTERALALVDVQSVIRALAAALDAYDSLRALAPSLPEPPLWIRRLLQGCDSSSASSASSRSRSLPREELRSTSWYSAHDEYPSGSDSHGSSTTGFTRLDAR
jgi:hypothetical protein